MPCCPRPRRLGIGAVLGSLVVLAGGCSGAPAAPAPSGRPPGATRPPVGSSAAPSAAASGTDRSPGWDIRAENARPGSTDWQLHHPAAGRIEGYADRAGVRPGTPVHLFVSTTARSFRIRAYRFGWYGGRLARLLWASADLPGRLQAPAQTRSRGMVVAPWAPSATVPTDGWPPGSYLLRLDAATGSQSWVPLVLVSPTVAHRLVLIQPVTSYQAYNTWGGRNLYTGPDGGSATRARAVSFDRPYASENGAGEFFHLEQPLVAEAERLGLPLAYTTGIDLDLHPDALDGASGAVSEGHDEYWSPAMRAVLVRSLARGTDLAFFGANAVYRKIRFEAAPSGPDRIEVNYKVPQEDPLHGVDDARVTGDWPAAPDPAPPDELTGQSYACFSPAGTPLGVADASNWVWAGTGVRTGDRLPGLVGPESDHVDPGVAPAHLTVLARFPVACSFGPATTGNTTLFVAASGAEVFDSGTEGWVCALRPGACREVPPAVTRTVVGRATANILVRFARGRPSAH